MKGSCIVTRKEIRKWETMKKLNIQILGTRQSRWTNNRCSISDGHNHMSRRIEEGREAGLILD